MKPTRALYPSPPSLPPYPDSSQIKSRIVTRNTLFRYVDNVKEREETFKTFPHYLFHFSRQRRTKLTAIALAECGLYYTGVSDCAACIACNVVIKDFKHNDDPVEKHAKASPSCLYLSKRVFPNFNSISEGIKHRREWKERMRCIKRFKQNLNEVMTREKHRVKSLQQCQNCVHLKCIICLDRIIEVVLEKCYHPFCMECIKMYKELVWYDQKCPFCRSYGCNPIKLRLTTWSDAVTF